jgi:proteasome activator subunit 4
MFLLLGDHLNDPQPIPVIMTSSTASLHSQWVVLHWVMYVSLLQSTIRKTLGDFKRTHHDSWEQHSLKFTEQQLAVLQDLIIPPTYYA